MTAVSGGALAARLERIQAAAADLAARASWPAERLGRHRQEELRSLVAHAVASSPYYRDVLGADAAAGEVTLEQLPTLPKATLMEEFDRIVTDPRLRRADLELHLAGDGVAEPYLGEYRVFSTSGSSGRHGIVVFGLDEFDRWIAAHLPVFARLGLSPQTRLASIGAPSAAHLSKQLFAAFAEGREPAPRLSVLTPVPELVAALEAYQPEALIGYASAVALVAQEQLDGRLRIEPSIVAVGAEVLTAEMEDRIVAAWGIRPAQVYATTEVPIVAASAADRSTLLVLDDLVLVENVDEQGRPVPPGRPGHKLLVTNLVNRVQPLIRYELTDSVTFDPEPAGSAFGRIASIDGRSDDVLHLRGAAGGEVAIHPHRLRAPFTRLPDVSQYQILSDGAALDVRIVPRRGAPAGTAEHVRATLHAAIREAGAVPPPIRVDAVAAIDREPGHAAKLKLIKMIRPPSA